jgi:hypothetical protein
MPARQAVTAIPSIAPVVVPPALELPVMLD